jgi:exosortase A-associated hydrolase 1
MGEIMRRLIEFACEGSALAGTFDGGASGTGLIIVSGGNEIRIGAHRGMAELAQTIASKGHPVFRFDRRGIGDSAGENGGFQNSAPDMAAALGAFRAACPMMHRVIAFGNCDAATALIIHDLDVDALVLANPWIIEPNDHLPPPAAIKDRYARRLRDPKAWVALLTGKLNLRAVISGLRRIIAGTQNENGLAAVVAARFGQSEKPTTILLAESDNTAIAFADAWKSETFARARSRLNIKTVTLKSSSHSFANDADFAVLVDTLMAALDT